MNIKEQSDLMENLIDRIQDPELKRMVRKLIDLEREANKEQEKHSYLTGWVCPICGKVYAPYTTQCFHCNNKGNWWSPGKIVYNVDLNYISQSNQNVSTTTNSIQTIGK